VSIRGSSFSFVPSLWVSLPDNSHDWFQTSAAPALPGGSFEGETREVHGLSGTRILNIDAQDAQD